MAANDIQARKNTEAQLIDRAMREAAFRAELLADPKAVFARELGLDMPHSITVQMLQETPTTVYLVLPEAMPSANVELSDAELEHVAGGWSGATDCSTCGKVTCQASEGC